MCAMTGCSKEGAGEEKAQGNNMLLVDTKWNEEIEYYFIDENLEVKTYSGYQSMGAIFSAYKKDKNVNISSS